NASQPQPSLQFQLLEDERGQIDLCFPFPVDSIRLSARNLSERQMLEQPPPDPLQMPGGRGLCPSERQAPVEVAVEKEEEVLPPKEKGQTVAVAGSVEAVAVEVGAVEILLGILLLANRCRSEAAQNIDATGRAAPHAHDKGGDWNLRSECE
ncbi:unnamed protein product, partial [Cyprideis torosa]